MIIYVIEEYGCGKYEDDTKRTDLFYTSNKEKLYSEIGDCIDNNFDQSFDVMGYKIPEDVVKQYRNSVKKIYEEWLSKLPDEKMADLLVFGQTFEKRFLLCTDRDEDRAVLKPAIDFVDIDTEINTIEEIDDDEEPNISEEEQERLDIEAADIWCKAHS